MLLLLISLASYRLWRLLALDDLPIVAKPRERYFDRYAGTWKADLVECPWCSGSWIAFAVTGLTNLFYDFPLPVLYALVSATIVGFIGAKLDSE